MVPPASIPRAGTSPIEAEASDQSLAAGILVTDPTCAYVERVVARFPAAQMRILLASEESAVAIA